MGKRGATSSGTSRRASSIPSGPRLRGGCNRRKNSKWQERKLLYEGSNPGRNWLGLATLGGEGYGKCEREGVKDGPENGGKYRQS